MDSPAENYIFLGTQFNTHFFLHITNNINYTVDIPSQIYNVLINEKFIIDSSDNVVIYSFNKKCEIIIIQHVNNPKNNIFSKENLESFFEVLLNADRNDSYIIQYDYNKKYYKTYYTKNVQPFALAEELKFNNSTIINIITSKPIINV
jgi:hypothetical protein